MYITHCMYITYLFKFSLQNVHDLASFLWKQFPFVMYLFKFNNGNARAMFGICSKLIKTPERHH